MFGLGKKKGNAPPAPAAGGRGVPTQKVLSMSSQGFSEPEIVKTLREDGFSPIEVDRAMKDAMRSGSSGSAQGVPQMPAMPQEPQRPLQPRQLPPMSQEQPSPQQPEIDDMTGDEPFSPRGFNMPPAASKNQFAPTKWDDDLDDMDDIDDVPKERKMGPDAFIDRMEDSTGMGPPPIPRDELEPLPFARPPLPKDKDDRTRILKERRRRDIEELTEEIADEKMKEIAVRFSDLEERLEKIESYMKNAASQSGGSSPDELINMKKDIGIQKESIEETNARIDSIEEVVKSSLNPMIESIRKMKFASSPAPVPEPPKAPEKKVMTENPLEKPKAREAPEPQKDDEPGEPPRYAPPKSR